MMRTYNYTLSGIDAYRTNWTVRGTVTSALENLMEAVLMRTFTQLSGAQARGPFTIKHWQFDLSEEGKADETDHNHNRG